MRAGAPFLLLPLLLASLPLAAGCSTVDSAITRASWKESFRDLFKGKDRGVFSYATDLAKHTTQVDASGRYQYVAPAYVSNYLVQRTVEKLGATDYEGPDELALVVDRLFHVLARDPTAAVRASAAGQLGALVLRLSPEDAGVVPSPAPPGTHGDARINQIVADLNAINARIAAGERIKETEVVERLLAMSRERPATFLSAQQMVRALAREPIAGAAPGGVTRAAEDVVPGLVRDCIMIALREVVCGARARGHIADPEPLVRTAAARALVQTRSPFAVEAMAQRLKDPVDPEERDPVVRRYMVEYLGWAGGPLAFDTCVQRLSDLDSGVRFYSILALRRMTGTEVEPTAEAWGRLRAERPEWRLAGAEGRPE